MNSVSNTNPKVITFLGFLIGFMLIDDLSSSEQNSLGNFFELVGQVLLANAAQQSLIYNRAVNTPNINSQEIKSIYDPLIYDIDKLRDVLSAFNTNYTEDALNTLLSSIEIMKNEISKLKKEGTPSNFQQ